MANQIQFIDHSKYLCKIYIVINIYVISFQQVINFREILLCSTLSERAVKIEFQQYSCPHLQSILKLKQLIQTGCKIDVNTKGIIQIYQVEFKIRYRNHNKLRCYVANLQF
ncbi:unnamed protein product [Paramecium primaurelia]|uniref:Uncharacterized protein n=1 Tax=Paramecium primaurelia TaxID=5886 RepID=A0A8S1KH88_PARPR|nr:unnamed protein product [Paramecium primaurelia]